jgi:hypothetical protein
VKSADILFWVANLDEADTTVEVFFRVNKGTLQSVIMSGILQVEIVCTF